MIGEVGRGRASLPELFLLLCPGGSRVCSATRASVARKVPQRPESRHADAAVAAQRRPFRDG